MTARVRRRATSLLQRADARMWALADSMPYVSDDGGRNWVCDAVNWPRPLFWDAPIRGWPTIDGWQMVVRGREWISGPVPDADADQVHAYRSVDGGSTGEPFSVPAHFCDGLLFVTASRAYALVRNYRPGIAFPEELDDAIPDNGPDWKLLGPRLEESILESEDGGTTWHPWPALGSECDAMRTRLACLPTLQPERHPRFPEDDLRSQRYWIPSEG